MFNRFRSVLYNVVGNADAVNTGKDGESYVSSDFGDRANRMPLKFPYRRPDFLLFATDEEMMVSADHCIRPIIVPRDIGKIPWKSGYAETINAGKSVRNEDQATIQVGLLRRENNSLENDNFNQSNCDDPSQSLPYVYFAVFDGHAGAGAAVAASHTLHRIVHDKLIAVLDLLLVSCSSDVKRNEEENGRTNRSKVPVTQQWFPEKEIHPDSLVVGALEAAFKDMFLINLEFLLPMEVPQFRMETSGELGESGPKCDFLIEQDRLKYKMLGGCTALVALFLLGKLYVANAGDSRAIICRGEKVIPMSNDFTPESERQRIRELATIKPELLGNDYTAVEFSRRPVRKDIGKKLLCREPFMEGWAYKTVSSDDLKFPLIYGEGKRSRVLATIGVTRGFGDHDLKAQSSNLNIKPFLSAHPEIKIYDVANEELSENDVLVMGTDGLWDITFNEKAAEIVQKTLDHFSVKTDGHYRFRYTSAAQDLVMHSRGKLQEKNWKTANGKPATIDDITVFVIPLYGYKEDYVQWSEAKCFMAALVNDEVVADADGAEEAKES